MHASDIRTLYAYNSWANQRILGAAAKLPPETWTTARLGYAQLRDTLVHTMSAEWNWRSRWQENISPTALLDPNDYPSLDAVRARWAEERAKMQLFLDGLTDTALNTSFDYKTTSGKPNTNTLWHTMQHLALHSMQHRAELALLLTELGSSPGDIDLIAYVRETAL